MPHWRSAILAAACALLIGASAAPVSAAEVYRWKDASGVTHYSDKKPDAAGAERMRLRDATPPAAQTEAVAPSPPAAGSADAPPAVKRTPRIVMYGQPSCGYCVKAARYFDAHGLPFRNIDISASKSDYAEFKRLGGQGTPLIFVDGQPIRGFNQARLDQLLFGGNTRR